MGGGPNSVGKGAGGGKHLPGGGAPFSYIPPAAIQNAMMTKDKKPFTYTPGGIDFLAEIRSPRMQRRISKNAADEGVANHPHHHQNHPANHGQSAAAPATLSPQALMAMQPQMAVPVFPPTPQQLPVLHSPISPAVSSPPPIQHHQTDAPPPPAPPPMRINLKPAVPQFLQSPPTPSSAPHPPPSPEQIIQESINSLPGRSQMITSPVQSPVPVSSPPSATPSNAPPVSFPERRNAQLGSIYIPPVQTNNSGGATAGTSNGHASSGPMSPLASAQLSKTPMPWMNSQNRTPSSPPPPFVHQQPERIIPIQREESKMSSGQVRMIPIAVEGATRTASTPQRSASTVKDDPPPWHQSKVIPIHLESAGAAISSAPAHQRQHDSFQQQQQAPWRTQAAANANQIASMMEE